MAIQMDLTALRESFSREIATIDRSICHTSSCVRIGAQKMCGNVKNACQNRIIGKVK